MSQAACRMFNFLYMAFLAENVKSVGGVIHEINTLPGDVHQSEPSTSSIAAAVVQSHLIHLMAVRCCFHMVSDVVRLQLIEILTQHTAIRPAIGGALKRSWNSALDFNSQWSPSGNGRTGLIWASTWFCPAVTKLK